MKRYILILALITNILSANEIKEVKKDYVLQVSSIKDITKSEKIFKAGKMTIKKDKKTKKEDFEWIENYKYYEVSMTAIINTALVAGKPEIIETYTNYIKEGKGHIDRNICVKAIPEVKKNSNFKFNCVRTTFFK